MNLIFEMIGANFFIVFTMMTLLWMIYFFRGNAGIVDIGWALSFIISIWLYLILGDGWWLRKWILALMVTLWAGRLGWHIFERYEKNEEDPRYKHLREGMGPENTNLKMLLLFWFQGFLALILGIPFLIAALDRTEIWYNLQFWGVGIWLIGILGETLADQQLKEFKENPINEGRVCQKGLWYFSRHPNYFFEWVTWIGFFLFALPSPGGLAGLISPLIMLYLLLQVSGIPLTELQSIKSKGEAYRDYQKTTSAFFPWFKKRGS